jgi:hypothetical protein
VWEDSSLRVNDGEPIGDLIDSTRPLSASGFSSPRCFRGKHLTLGSFTTGERRARSRISKAVVRPLLRQPATDACRGEKAGSNSHGHERRAPPARHPLRLVNALTRLDRCIHASCSMHPRSRHRFKHMTSADLQAMAFEPLAIKVHPAGRSRPVLSDASSSGGDFSAGKQHDRPTGTLTGKDLDPHPGCRVIDRHDP